MLERIDETIVAISSAPGVGWVGIVRLSGPDAIPIADRMVALGDGRRLVDLPGSMRACGEVEWEDGCGVPAVMYLFRGPRSYTRQDLVEIHTIGSPPVLELIRRRAVELGARPAEPGEFTARAFLHGAMDLSEAEAVAGMIRAQSDIQLRAARRMSDGALAERIRALRDELAELLALVEADIDFAEEPIEFITPSALRERLSGVRENLGRLLSSAVAVERFDALPRILLFGRPNAGKSSLMNRLSGISRAICAAAAGTTRDILSAPISLGRGEAILLDSAGVDESDDVIIAQGRALTLSAAERVDLVCLVVDLVDPQFEKVEAMVRSAGIERAHIAANKLDAVDSVDAERALARLGTCRLGPVCAVSAVTGQGLSDLRAGFATALGDRVTTTEAEALLISERQRAAIDSASGALDRAMRLAEGSAETAACADLVAFELREALDFLGTVTGDVTTEDLLGQVFSRFCIGK